MENKENESKMILGEFNKIIPGEFDCTMDKMDKDGGNKPL